MEPLPRWAKIGAACVAAAAGLVWVGVAVWGEDSPWCDDGNDSACATEVLVDGQAFPVSCVDGRVAPEARGADLTVEARDGGELRAWAFASTPVDVAVQLDPGHDPCPGTLVAIGPNATTAEARDLVAAAGR